MDNKLLAYFLRRPVTSGLTIFVVLLFLTQFLTYQRYTIRKDSDRIEISNQAAWTKERLQSVINFSFSSTQTLAFIIENYGVPQDFDSVAKQLLKANKYIDAVELVQGGTITNVYPLKGNEAVLGFNILLDSARKSGALATIEKKGFFISGPINFKQGGAGFVSRIPIFKNNQFWGFSAVLIKLSTLLEAAGIDTSHNTNFSYQLAKVNVSTGQEEFFLQSPRSFKKEFSIPVEIPNGEWKLYIIAGKSITFSAIFFFALLGFILSATGGLFAWFIVKQPSKLNQLVQEKTLLLQDSEKNYRTTLERIADAFVAIDTNWCFTYMNQKAGEIFNCDPKTIIGKNIWSEFPDSANQPFYIAMHKAMQQQQYISIEEHSQSAERWFEYHIYPSPEGVSVFFGDITKRKKTEQELRQSNERFQLISRATNDALWEWNFVTGDLWGNEMHQQLFGLTIADPVPNEDAWKERIHPEDRNIIVDKQAASLISNKSVFITEYRFRLPNNEYRYIYDRCYILRNDEGQPLRMVGSMMDITEQKKAEQEIEIVNEQLRQLTRHLQNIREEERKRIAREIHDDLGQQLTGIKMGIAWINKKIPDDSAEIKDKLGDIISLVNASNVSVRRILNELRTDILDNYGLLEALEWQGRQFTATTDIPLLFNSPEESKIAEEPVNTCIFRIYQEALTNISKYAQATKVSSTLTYSNNNIIFSIADNGIGFDPDLLKTKKSFGILGMRERVASLSGTFNLESYPGNGTTITISIPF